jgi:DNA-binding transcriptional LysR family regulator
MADRRLQVFHTVARLLSFTKAAETLHMTQPAVTFQVRQLEDYFNTRLFDRTHNRISLTQAGERVFEYSERILDLYGEMDNSVRELTGEISGVLMLGASTTIAEYMLPEMLGAFKTKYPNLVVRLKVGNTDGVVQMIENNVIDLGIVEAPVLNKKLQVELCRNDELVLVVPPKHPLVGKSSVSLKEIVQYPYIWREEGSGTREVIRDQLEHAGINPDELDVIMELGSPEAVKGAVEAGIGMTILSRSSIQKELRLGTVIAIPLDPQLTRPFSFVHQKQKFRLRAIEELLEFAREYCAQQSKK